MGTANIAVYLKDEEHVVYLQNKEECNDIAKAAIKDHIAKVRKNNE